MADDLTAVAPAGRSADVRLALVAPVRTAVVVGSPTGWVLAAAEGLAAPAGVPDLAVGGPDDAAAAVATGAGQVLLSGRPRLAPLRRAGYDVLRLLVQPGRSGPRAVLPSGDRRAAAAGFDLVAPRPGLRGRARQAGWPLVAAGVVPRGWHATLAVRGRLAPPWIAAGQSADPRSWLLQLGDGDPLQRVVLHLPGHRGDGVVVKVSRAPGHTGPFDRDAEGARRALDAGVPRVPRVLVRDDVAGLPRSVEERAPGRSLHELLASAWPERRRVALAEQVVDWARDLGRRTATAADGAAREALAPVIGEAAGRVPDCPSVLTHGDLGSWNVVSDGVRFSVVDWESARSPGLPLSDLVYFLADAVPTLDRLPHDASRTRAVLALFRGEHRLSPMLFRAVREAAAELSVPAAHVGPLVTATWLLHAVSPEVRAETLRLRVGPLEDYRPRTQPRLVEPWLDDPALGWRWSAWR